MRIAAATENGKAIDAHFGKTSTFNIYDTAHGMLVFHETREVTPLSENDPNHPFNPERFEQVAKTLQDCTRIYCQKIGERPKKEMEKRGFEIIEYSGSIEDIRS